MAKNNWYVITGGPSTGKTAVLKELEKLGHKTIPEAARTVIDEALEKGISVEELRADEKRFQDDVAKRKEQIESEHDKATLTFFDRGMHDTLAYMRHYGYGVDDWLLEMMNKAKYQKVFLLGRLPKFKDDYARTEDQDFTKKIHELLHDAYAQYGMKPIIVPDLGKEGRAKFILDIINGDRPE